MSYDMNTLTRFRKPLQYILAIVAIVCIAIVVANNWTSFVAAVASMNPAWIFGSLLFGILGVVLSMLAWRSVARAFGYPVSVRSSANIVFISQIGKYIPGGVWPIVVGSRLGAAAGIPAVTTAITLMVQLLMSVATGCVVAVGVLLTFPTLAAHYWWLIVIVLVVGIGALLPPVMARWLRFVLKLLRRSDQLPSVIRLGDMGVATLWSIGSWVAFGLHLWCILTALDGVDPGTIVLAISGYALAWVAGFIAILAPAGAGVREAVLGLILAASFTTSDILGIVLVSRFVLIVVDLGLFAFALATSRRVRHDPTLAIIAAAQAAGATQTVQPAVKPGDPAQPTAG
jgi:hypothetical protein